VFTELTRKNGSSRVMCYQYARSLRALGIDMHLFPPSSVFLCELLNERVTWPGWLVLLCKAVYWYLCVAPRRIVQIARSAGCDVVYVQRGLFRYGAPPVLEWVLWLWAKKLLGRPILYALDDAQYLVANARYFHFRFRMADWVSTGNDAIADYARTFNPHVWILESSVDTDAVEPKQHDEHWPVVIGWTGTLLDDTGYLGTLRGAMEKLSRRLPVVLRVVSNRPLEAAGATWVKNRRWTLEGEWENLRSFDIGVMPLPDEEFTRAKEGYKLKQYMAAGLPVVCSPVGQNTKLAQDGVNGFFASTEQEWVEKLALLASDWQLRAKMGRAGRTFVEQHYSMRVVAPRLAALFREACGNKSSRVSEPATPFEIHSEGGR